MKNNHINFLSHFEEKGISSIFTNHGDYDNKFDYFLRYLSKKYNIINDEEDIDVLSELDKFKNTTVLVLKPTNFGYDDGSGEQPWQMKSRYILKIRDKSINNNLSIILFTYSYKTQYKNNEIDNNQMTLSNFVIEYKDNKIHIHKNRYGDNESFDIELLKPLWLNEQREDKLKRILKHKLKYNIV